MYPFTVPWSHCDFRVRELLASALLEGRLGRTPIEDVLQVRHILNHDRQNLIDGKAPVRTLKWAIERLEELLELREY